MSLIEEYDAAISRQEISDDPAQRQVLVAMQRVVDELAIKSSWFQRKKPVSGLYLYGPVGVGKTYLGDLFYQHVQEPRKARFHFHQFMQQVDAQLRLLQGQKDPLRCIAANIAKTTRVLCFDEFMVDDVADAMILAELFQALFAHDVVLVATSNTAPDALYLNGPHRDRFLPAIALIKQHCQVYGLTEHCDYRLGRGILEQAYLYPLNAVTQQAMLAQFAAMTVNPQEEIDITIQKRQIHCVKCSDRAVWFTFNTLCNLPRSQLDYLEIADRFDTVFVSDVPVLTEDHTTRVILLIHLIDVLYDRGLRLVISAAVPVIDLYPAGPMVKNFQRTLSRLEEMQSQDYLRRHQRREVQTLT